MQKQNTLDSYARTALVVSLVSLASLGGYWTGRCQSQAAPASTASAIPSTSDVYVFTDPLTGCDYLTAPGTNAGYTPRLHSDGIQVCDGRDSEPESTEDQGQGQDQDQVLPEAAPSTQITPYVPAIDGPVQDSPALVQVRFVF